MIDLVKCQAERIVIAAGGLYIGTFDRLILFNSKQTGSTLALPVKKVLEGGRKLVEEHIKESNSRFEKRKNDD